MEVHDSYQFPDSGNRPNGDENFRPTPIPKKQVKKSRFSMLPRSIRNKIIYSLLIIYLLGTMAAFTALTSISHLGNKINLLEAFYELNQLVLETRRYEKNFLLYGNTTDLMSALDYVDEVRAAMEKLNNRGLLPNTAIRIMPNSLHQLGIYADLLQRVSTIVKQKSKLNHLTGKLREQGHIFTRTVLKMDNLARKEIERNINNNRKMVFIILASGLILGALLNVMLARWILEPLKYIHHAVAEILEGKLTKVPIIPKIEECSECAELIYSLNSLLSALEEKQKQLIQSTKMAAIGKVTAGIAHEINNPLNNISLTAEVLLEDFSNLEREECFEMVTDIVTQADRAREVVLHLLDFSKIHQPSTWQPVELQKLLEDTLIIVRNQITLNRVTVEKNQPEQPIFIMGNARQLQQVLVNIILNSIQATGEGGQLYFSISSSQEEAVISIADNGPGIPKEIGARIFDPFFTTKDEGTGLGLSVSYAIIKEHKGEIAMKSAAAEGTTFDIILPRVEQKAPGK